MENIPSPRRPLSERVMRRQVEILEDILPEIARVVFDDGRPADAVLQHYLRSHRELGSRDRRFLSQAVFSFFRWHGWTVGKLGLSAREACLLGVALDSPELSETFQYLEKRCKLPRPLGSLVGQSLAEKATLLDEWFGREGGENPPLQPADLVFPGFGSLVDPEKALRCIEQFQRRPPTWLRARGDAPGLCAALGQGGVEATPHDRLGEAIAVPGGTALGNALAGNEARFVVQDISSQCVGRVCNPQKDGDWWDCCAGAGGKSIHLVDLMGREGKVLATDIRLSALKELRKRAHRYGIRHIRTQAHNVAHDEPFRKTFDGVLVDAPCSGWGTWGRNPDARWRTSRRDVVQYAARQLRILDNAAWCVKPGGTLVYAVCTLTRPETEEVVMRFLEQRPEFGLDPFDHPLDGTPTDGKVQIWPWDGPGDAMFIARFVRRGD